MGPTRDVIDLCSDSEADSLDEHYKIVSLPEPSPKRKKTTTTTAAANTTPQLPAIATTKTIPLSSFRPAATVTAPTALAPIFCRNIKPTFADDAELEVVMPEPSKACKEADNKKRKKPAPKYTALTQNAAYCGPVDAGTLLDKLNSAQRRAVTSDASTVAILAGPGSGKTHTLTSRVAWLIDQVGYAPANVIVATFTVKAAREMKERIGKVLGGGREKRIVLGTFHSVSLRYLSAYGTRIGLAPGFSIVDDGDAKSILKRIIKRLNVALEPPVARSWISKKKAKGCLGIEDDADKARSQRQRQASRGGVANNEDAAHSQDFLTKLEAVYDEYQKHLQSLNLLDYDDLLIRCAALLRAHPACVGNVQAVLIDEYQDTNGVQFELMKLFAQHCQRITVVGDPDQSIYGWRSADTTNLVRFLSDFPRTAEIALEENYRSSQCILATSLQVIQQDAERYDKSLLPVHTKGSLPVLRRLRDAPSEARWIVQEIQRATLLSGRMVTHSDVAVLVRSAALSRPIEQALARAAIPYRMIGGRKFFERAEVKLLVDYLRVINQPTNNEVLSRIINVPRRGIGPKTIQSCLEAAETHGLSLWTLLIRHCRGERTAHVAIKEPAAKKMARLIGLVERMQRRLRGVEGGEEDEEEQDSQPVDDEDDDDEKDEADGPMGHHRNDNIDNDKKRTPAPPKNGTLADAFVAEPAKPYNLVELIMALTDELRYRDYIGETFGGDEEARWANVDEFVTLAREFMANAKTLMDEDTLPTVDGLEQTRETDVLNKFLANISLSAEADKKQEGNGEPVPMVTISTIHAAKGLEWPVVFIPAAYEGSLPHSRSDDFNEERRLLYVAMTRAKCLLNISYSLFGADRNKDGGSSSKSEQSLSPYLSGLVDVCFAERGPSFDRALLDEMGNILGRPVPKHGDIYRDLPHNMPMEDSVFPLDPLEESRYQNDGEAGGYEYGGRHRQQQQQQQQNLAKRRRIADTPDYNTAGGPWQRGYTTTMEGGGSNFTMGGGTAYPGFTTASAHQTALLAAEATAAATAAAERQAPATDKRKRGALPTGQRTIMQSFARSNSTGSTSAPDRVQQRTSSTPPVAPLFQRPALQHSTSLPPGIPAELRGRSLGGVRGNMMPMGGLAVPSLSVTTDAKTNDEQDKKDKKNNTGRRYAHFSSSPTRAEPPPMEEEPAPAPVEARRPSFGFNPPRPYKAPHRRVVGIVGKENLVGGGAADKRPALATARPAASFHTTTYAQVQANGNARKRPGMNTAGGLGNLAPMDKLRRPFKPPSIQRPQ